MDCATSFVSGAAMFERIFRRRTETRSVGLDALLALGGASTAAGVSVNPSTAMRCSAVFACVRIIGETVQQVPLHLYRRQADGGRERVTDHPAAKVLRQPSDFMTAAEFKMLLGTHLAAHGNFFSWTGRDGTGALVEMIPLAPTAMSVRPDDVTMAPIYTLTAANGGQRQLDRRDLLHVRGPGLDIYKGASPVEMAREAIGLSLTLEKHCATLFGRGAKPSGVLKSAKALTDPVITRLRSSFDSFFGGGENSGKTLVLEDGLEFTPLQLSSVDSQTLEMRRHQIAEVSRYWRVPLSLLNELDRVTHSNAEALGQQFLTFCMLPIFRNITDALALTLLTPEERDEFYFEFLVDDLARADLAARMQAYATAISHGLMSPDECRQRDNLAPVPDGSGAIFTRPVNVAPVAPKDAPK
ncbi:MAG: phage portal protein [Rhodospirillales bacterium]|nr:MAG: phage portal protein [Rhodospirillales bacterium]